MNEEVHRQNPVTGAWEPAEPEPWAPGIDFEVYGRGPYEWQAYRGPDLLAQGRARTRIGLAWSIRRAKSRLEHGGQPR